MMRSFGSFQLVCLIGILLMTTCDSFDFNEVVALQAFKEAIFEDPHMVLSNWNSLDADPCNWRGIYCSPTHNHIITLNLSGSSLKGFLAPELGLLSSLQELALHNNNLLGAIPKHIGALTNLKLLDLGLNQLSGPIPPELGNLVSATKINLQSNGLTGSVPPELGNLRNLVELRLDRNKLQGTVPANNSRTTQTQKSHPTANSEHQHPAHVSKHRDTSKPGWLLALEVVTGTVAGFLLLFAILTGLTKLKGKSPVIIPWKKAGNEKDQCVIYIDPDLLKDVKRWSRQELEVACEDFSNIIGSSPDSIVYKGVVKDGPEIAVICPCINAEYWTGYLELYFQKEVADLARINHENTGKLLGYCRESTPFSRMLVFQYASNGTLYEHLHYGEGCQLSWARRMRIIIGIARGLKYLHTELNPPFTISELNSSAVYLTEDFSPKLVDFESWKAIYARSGKSADSDQNGGVICGFPDSIEARHLDVEANIFAFGVLLLEIISGRPPYCKDRGCLVDWV
ncbi:hypothetical protein AQUCO_03800041v1 [Aquilegia coerulea]|uniref:Protein kinase domain-containing protein n=1 Tax=Aquilegia coerulea TaxID=218851 RepID=A0A2G5CSA9_AQUCA|nr:hypothetical protein AQUCO_03800041v1 [Aquilegia coerulea]